MSAAIDARTLPAGTVLTPDLAIIGGGPAGISLALALADSGHDILLLESGGMVFDAKVQSLYAGQPDRRGLYRAGWRTAALSGRQHQSLGRLVPAAGRDRFRGAALDAPFRLAVRPRGARTLFRPRPGAGRGRTLDL